MEFLNNSNAESHKYFSIKPPTAQGLTIDVHSDNQMSSNLLPESPKTREALNQNQKLQKTPRLLDPLEKQSSK